MITKAKKKKVVKAEETDKEMSYDRWVSISREEAEKMVEDENARLVKEGKQPTKKLYRFTLGSHIESRNGDIKATVQYAAGSAHVLWCAANNNYHADWLCNAHLGHQASSKEDVSFRNAESAAMSLPVEDRKALLRQLQGSLK